jgi:hypothetical protein
VPRGAIRFPPLGSPGRPSAAPRPLWAVWHSSPKRRAQRAASAVRRPTARGYPLSLRGTASQRPASHRAHPSGVCFGARLPRASPVRRAACGRLRGGLTGAIDLHARLQPETLQAGPGTCARGYATTVVQIWYSAGESPEEHRLSRWVWPGDRVATGSESRRQSAAAAPSPLEAVSSRWCFRPSLIYPPRAKQRRPRRIGLVGELFFSAKLICMGKNSNVLTKVQSPDRRAHIPKKDRGPVQQTSAVAAVVSACP